MGTGMSPSTTVALYRGAASGGVYPRRFDPTRRDKPGGSQWMPWLAVDALIVP